MLTETVGGGADEGAGVLTVGGGAVEGAEVLTGTVGGGADEGAEVLTGTVDGGADEGAEVLTGTVAGGADGGAGGSGFTVETVGAALRQSRRMCPGCLQRLQKPRSGHSAAR